MIKKIFTLLTIGMILFTSTAFAFHYPQVNLNRVILSGVNVAFTSRLNSGELIPIPFQMFARLLNSYSYTIVVNAEWDAPLACQVIWLGPDGSLWEPLDGTQIYEEGRYIFSPSRSGLYSVFCLVPENKLDLIGIVIEVN